MAIITRKGKRNKTYYVKVRDKYGRFLPSKSFKIKADAQRYERELLNIRDTGVLAASLRSSLEFSVLDYWNMWQAERRSEVSDSWKVVQDQIARDHILPYIGHLKLAEVRSPDIGRVMLVLRDEKELASQTRLHVYNILHRMFDDAIEYYEIIQVNPVKKKDRPRLIQRERDFLPPNELRKLLVRSRSHRLGPAVWLAGLAGMRISEIQALRFDALDFERGRIVIREAYKRKVDRIEPYPKQRFTGSAPMVPELETYLKELSRGQHPRAFVAKSATGGMLPYRAFYFGLRELCEQAEVKVVTPHELRHSCTEFWVEHGANLEDLRRLLNHSSTDAIRAYIHRTDERLNSLATNVRVGAPRLLS